MFCSGSVCLFSGKATPLEGTSVLAHIPSRWKVCHGYSHSFAMSGNYVIYLEQPLAVNVMKLATSHIRHSTFNKSLEYYENEKVIFSWCLSLHKISEQSLGSYILKIQQVEVALDGLIEQ